MATETSSIDDLLSTQRTALQPETPETKSENDEPEEPEISYDEPDSPIEEDSSDIADSADEPEEEKEPEKEFDDYGNEKAQPKTYTEDEVNDRINKAIRERLARGQMSQQQQPTQQQVRQQGQDFEYNPDSQETWQQQLERFVETTVTRMSEKQQQQAQVHKEQQIQAEFEQKFTQNMEKFSDFREVVGSQPISDPMTLSLRAMKDPAAFIYAASKRHPQELQRISNIPDAYTQMVEMGRLEERMRKTAAGTKAPKPLSRTQEDGSMNLKNDKDKSTSIEDLIRQSETKKMARMKLRRGTR